MESPFSAFPGKDLLERNPAALLVIPTLSLLLGQAAVATPPLLPLLVSVLFFILSIGLGWSGKGRWAFLFLFSGAAFSLGYFPHHRLLHPQFPKHHLRLLTDGREALYIEGVLYREPERQPQRSRWYLRVERIWHPHGAQETEGNVLVTVREAVREWQYRDQVRFWLKLRPPRNAGNPGEFDYEAYLARRRIHLTGFLQSDAGVELLRREPRSLWGFIEHLRREIRRFFERHLPHRQAALMKALVVGDRGGISQEMREGFAAAGVAHLLSISGLHVGMLGLVVFFLVRFLGSLSTNLLLRWNWLKVATFFSFLAVIFYTALAGARVPTVRSAIMVGVYVTAVLLDREEELYSSLAFAALLIGLLWPGAIMDISFQLSFLAVLFIIWGLRRMQEMRPFQHRDELPRGQDRLRRRLRQLTLYLAVPVLATVGTGPMIAYHFGRVSLAAFLSNAVIVPFVGLLVVPLGLLIGFASLLFPVLALPLIWLAGPLLSLTLTMVGFFANLPVASVPVPTPSLLELGILYLLVCSVLCARRRLHLYFFIFVSVVLLMGDGAYWWRQRWNRGDLRITYLSVGHGDAAVVEFPGSKVLLIDAGGGASRRFDPGKSIIAPFLRSRRIAKVDYVLVSHPRVDHYGGMMSVLEGFAPSEFWSGPIGAESVRYLQLEKTVEELGIKRVVLSRSDSCRWIGKVQLCFLYPPKGHAGEASLVLRLSFRQYHFLFPGDIRKKDEKKLLQSGTDLSSQVLKVPRHGSLSSSTRAFVAAVSPRLAIFSVGPRNPFGLPQAKVVTRYLEAGSETLRTGQDGAVTVETDGKKLRYWTFRSGKRGEIRVQPSRPGP